MNNIKKNPPKSFKISIGLFVTNILVAIFSLGFILTSHNNFLIILLVVISNIAFFFPSYINYKSTELLISKRKVYIKNKFLKTQTVLDLVSDLKYYKKEQSILGKVFNYGTIQLVDSQDRIIKIECIESPEKIEEEIINNTKKYLKYLGINVDENINDNVKTEDKNDTNF